MGIYKKTLIFFILVVKINYSRLYSQIVYCKKNIEYKCHFNGKPIKIFKYINCNNDSIYYKIKDSVFSRKVNHKYKDLEYVDNSAVFHLLDTLYKYIFLLTDSIKWNNGYHNFRYNLEDSIRKILFIYDYNKNIFGRHHRFFLSLKYFKDSINFRINLFLTNNKPKYYYGFESVDKIVNPPIPLYERFKTKRVKRKKWTKT